MKKIRIIVIVLLMFILSGCSGNYNLTFNEDLSLKEELDINIKNENNNYERTFYIFEKGNVDSDKYEIIADDNNVYIKYTENYDSFEDYLLNSNLYHMIFENIDYSKDNKGMILNTESYLKLDDKVSNEIVNSYDIDNLKINLKIPFSINKSNEDSKNNDVLTWELNKNDTYKEINIDFSYRKASTLSIILIFLLGGSALLFVIFIVVNIIRRNKI